MAKYGDEKSLVKLRLITHLSCKIDGKCLRVDVLHDSDVKYIVEYTI